MPITDQTEYRAVGPVPYKTWHDTITAAGGRSALASKAAWQAAGSYSAILLRLLEQESSFDTDYAANSPDTNNPYNIRVPDRSNEGSPAGYVHYETLVAATDAAARRIDGQPGFFDGPNPYASTQTIRDLISTYAPPPWNKTEELIKKMVTRLNQWVVPVTVPSTPEEPVAITFGKVPHPQYQQRIITNSTAWNDLGARTIRGVVWHRMYGTLWGTDTYFRGEASGKALTDYGVGVSATDGTGQAGVILMWNDPNGRRAPWASGPVSNPIDDGATFVNLYGINGVNRDAVSIEISGTSGSTALDAKARRAVVELTAYYADQYGKRLAAQGKQFDYTTWPIIPSENGRSFVMWHGEIYDGKRNSCPGAVVQAATTGMLDEIKVLLQQYQTGQPDVDPPVQTYADPQAPAAGNSVVNGRYFLAHVADYTLTKAVTPRVYADPGSDPTGPELPKGFKITTTHVVSDVGATADLTFVVGPITVDGKTIKTGSRIPVGVIFS